MRPNLISSLHACSNVLLPYEENPDLKVERVNMGKEYSEDQGDEKCKAGGEARNRNLEVIYTRAPRSTGRNVSYQLQGNC